MRSGWLAAAVLVPLLAVGCSRGESDPPLPADNGVSVIMPAPSGSAPTRCEPGLLSAKDVENTIHVPPGHDGTMEMFLANGRYRTMDGWGGAGRGTYVVCGDQICIGDRCRALEVQADGGILLEGVRLRPYHPPEPVKVPWARRPDAARTLEFYPVEALRDAVPGAATLRCRVSERGVLDRCLVLSESPEGRGFGAAALRLARYYRASPRHAAALRNTGEGMTFEVSFEPPARR